MSDPKNWIKASPEKLAAFYLKCNTEQSFRTAFLDRPVWLLRKFDIEVGEDAATEIEERVKALVEDFKERGLFEELAILPESWEMYGHELLVHDDRAWGILVKTDSQKGSIP